MLQELYLRGFKSFAEPVTVDFSDSSVTAIVGPNGSGKSNIVDAIRWVMGEQSPTALRGSKMSDVIFSGSENRSARQEAEVCMELDNSAGHLPLDQEQVTLGRRVDSDGSSSYFVNDENCRLKDIRNLLDDTGLNQEPYSVVGQNRVEAILNSSPEKLREIFEEAAGITRHRRRKEEAERRLERTEKDLQRVDDLIAEIENRLQPLEKEAKKARKYKNIYEEMKELEGSYLVASYQENQQKLQELHSKKQDLEELKQKAEANLADHKEKFSQLQARREELQDKIDETSSQLFQVKSRLQEISKNLDILEERENSTEKRLSRLQEQQIELQNKQEELEENLSELRNKKQQLEDKAREEKQRQQEILVGWQNLLREKLLITSRLQANSRGASSQQKEELSKKIAALQERKESLASLAAELREDEKKAEQKANSLQQKRQKLKEQKDSLAHRLAELQENGEQAAENLNSLQQKLDNKRDRLQNLQQKYSRCRSRWQARRRMQNQAQGYYSGVKAVMQEDSLKGIIGPVARLIEVQEKFETAIAAVLGSRLQQLVVEDTEAARTAINYLKQEDAGRATFLPLDMIEGRKLEPARFNLQQDSGYISPAYEVVDYEQRIENIIYYLLGQVVVAEAMKSAVRISRRTSSGCKIVTLEGELVNPGGSMTGGTRQEKSTILLRRSRQKQELAKKAAKLRQQSRKMREEARALEDELAERQQTVKNIKDKIASIRENKRETAEKLREFERQLNNLQDRRQELQQKADERDQKKIELQQRIAGLQNRRRRLDQEDRRQQARRELLQQKLQSLNSRIENLNHLLQSSELQLTKFQEKISAYNQDIDKLEEEYQDNCDRQEEISREINESNTRLDKVDSRRQNLKQKRQESQTEKQELEAKKQKLQQNLSRIKGRCTAGETELENYRQEKEEAEKDLHSVQLKIGKLESSQERVTGRLQDKYDLTISQAEDEFSPESQEEDPREQISQLEAELKQLGEVNLGAIDEFERLNSRYEFLQEEREDLLSARSSINGVITELEDKMSDLFLETFEQVDEEFQKTFTKLFNGGEAELELTEPETPLETGVDITARPPGKRLKRLSLLSGGEKALTAIALLFAFLEVNPSPIYVLDEIDSSLDDANLDMFAEFIKEYSNYSQFIIVTHRKRLMAIADTIYGVTMSENGVSRLVSLQYEQQMAQ